MQTIWLLNHYFQFKERLKLNNALLLHIEMDGSRVNLCFEWKLANVINQNSNTELLQLGTCSLYPVCTAFKKGLRGI